MLVSYNRLLYIVCRLFVVQAIYRNSIVYRTKSLPSFSIYFHICLTAIYCLRAVLKTHFYVYLQKETPSSFLYSPPPKKKQQMNTGPNGKVHFETWYMITVSQFIYPSKTWRVINRHIQSIFWDKTILYFFRDMHKLLIWMKLYEIRDSRGGEYYVYSVLGYDALYVDRYVCPKCTMSHYRLL